MTQPEALRLAEELCEPLPGFPEPTSLERAAGNELRRLHQHELASRDWLDKTNWVQETAQDGEFGMHRADVLKKRIDALNESNTELLAALKEILYGENKSFRELCEQARAAIAKGEAK
jgi:uncharacterized protein YifE (UPF0438 family)